MKNKITLEEAVRFHGHLGPYLVLGILAGELALKKLRCKKYFGLNIKIWGANEKPKSCLIDGLQLSTGATYGKGNIRKLNGSIIKMEFSNYSKTKKIIFKLKDTLIRKVNATKTHRNSESLAKRLYKADFSEIFSLTPHT